MRGRTLALMIAVNAAGWAAAGAGAVLLADGLLGSGAPSALVLLGGFALSSVIGALMPLPPAGRAATDPCRPCSLGSARARSSVDRALASGARGRRFKSCRARSHEANPSSAAVHPTLPRRERG